MRRLRGHGVPGAQRHGSRLRGEAQAHSGDNGPPSLQPQCPGQGIGEPAEHDPGCPDPGHNKPLFFLHVHGVRGCGPGGGILSAAVQYGLFRKPGRGEDKAGDGLFPHHGGQAGGRCADRRRPGGPECAQRELPGSPAGAGGYAACGGAGQSHSRNQLPLPPAGAGERGLCQCQLSVQSGP